MNEDAGDYVLVPMAVSKDVFALLTRAGVREGKSAGALLAERLNMVIKELAEKEPEKEMKK